MEIRSVILLVFMNTISTHARHEHTIKNILRVLRRNQDFPMREIEDLTIIDTPRYPEDLPEAEPIHPGHTLIRPTLNMLRSQVKFPLRDVSALVYGNLDNLGITYGNSPYRVKYTGFRKANNNLLNTIINAVKNVDGHKRNKKPALPQDSGDDENAADEIFDGSRDSEDGDNFESSFRRRHHSTSRHRYNDSLEYDCKNRASSSSSDSSGSDGDKNPGNPYSVYKGKYHENWMWNHQFDGLHMNINPYAPKFQSTGPSGGELFFNRKWWYFNQDDYKPLG